MLCLHIGWLFWCWRHSHSGFHSLIPVWGMFAWANSRPSSVSIHQREIEPLSSAMYTGVAREVVMCCWILSSDPLSRVGYVSRLSRLYREKRPCRCTTGLSNHGDVYSDARTLAGEAMAHAQGSICKTPCHNSIFMLVRTVSILCVILWACPRSSRVHSGELTPRFVCHALFPPSGINIGVGMYVWPIQAWEGRREVRSWTWGCIPLLHHLFNLSWSLSRPSQRTVSQICAPRFASSVGY